MQEPIEQLNATAGVVTSEDVFAIGARLTKQMPAVRNRPRPPVRRRPQPIMQIPQQAELLRLGPYSNPFTYYSGCSHVLFERAA